MENIKKIGSGITTVIMFEHITSDLINKAFEQTYDYFKVFFNADCSDHELHYMNYAGKNTYAVKFKVNGAFIADKQPFTIGDYMYYFGDIMNYVPL